MYICLTTKKKQIYKKKNKNSLSWNHYNLKNRICNLKHSTMEKSITQVRCHALYPHPPTLRPNRPGQFSAKRHPHWGQLSRPGRPPGGHPEPRESSSHAPRSRCGPRPLRSRTVSSHRTNRCPGAIASNPTPARCACAVRWSGWTSPTLQGAGPARKGAEHALSLKLCMRRFLPR